MVCKNGFAGSGCCDVIFVSVFGIVISYFDSIQNTHLNRNLNVCEVLKRFLW
ncbi:hypothetical protein ACIN8IBEIGE_200009 [Acinetobacter sp. 8I-beige]|nr:hypothetical protein ACIN8IBEIGE_200009 [Acinetobacter sp. 8I-beige]